MKDNNISPDLIFLTDESIINLSTYFGRNNKIKLAEGQENIFKMEMRLNYQR